MESLSLSKTIKDISLVYLVNLRSIENLVSFRSSLISSWGRGQQLMQIHDGRYHHSPKHTVYNISLCVGLIITTSLCPVRNNLVLQWIRITNLVLEDMCGIFYP